MELTEADAGADRPVSLGEDVVLRLPENRTTGYRWHLALPEDGVVVDEDRFDVDTSGRPGAGGVRTFRVRATAPGTHRLGATLQRSWGSPGDGPPGLEFRLIAR